MSECSGPDCDHPSHNHGNPRHIKMTPEQAKLFQKLAGSSNLIKAGQRALSDPKNLELLKSLRSNPDPQVSVVIDEVTDVDFGAIERRAAAQRILNSAVHFAVSEWMARCIRERRERLAQTHGTGRLKPQGLKPVE